MIGKRVKVTMTLSTGDEVPVAEGAVMGSDASGVLVADDTGRLHHCLPTWNFEAIERMRR